MNKQTLRNCLLFFLFIVLSSSCTKTKYNYQLQDKHLINDTSLTSILEELQYKEPLNDTILLGFRLGESSSDFQVHYKKLISQKKVQKIDNDKFFFTITLPHFSVKGMAVAHVFNNLQGIYFELYPPNKLVDSIPYNFEGLNILDAAVKRMELEQRWINRNADAFFNNLNVFQNELVHLYESRYGKVQHSIVEEMNSIWLNDARFINVNFEHENWYSSQFNHVLNWYAFPSENSPNSVIVAKGWYSTIPYQLSMYSNKGYGKDYKERLKNIQQEKENEFRVQADSSGI
jgi:hypothetical protein